MAAGTEFVVAQVVDEDDEEIWTPGILHGAILSGERIAAA
jgi:hypothetical protein